MRLELEDLLIKIAEEDQSALAELIRYFSDELFFFSLGIVKRREIAEEIVSDIFVALWNDRDQITKIRNLKSYLITSARNNSLYFLRSSKNKPHLSIDEIDSFYVEPLKCPETIMIDQENLEQINKAIALLPPKSKMAFTLAKINGLKYKEISELMGISPRTVENHIANAFERICQSIKSNQG